MKLAHNAILFAVIFLTLFLTACGGGGGGGGEGGDASNIYIVADPDQVQEVATGTFVVLDASNSTEKSGSEIHYHWTIINAPDGSQTSLDEEEKKSVNPSFVPDLDGTYEFELEISTEENGEKITSKQEVTVVANSGNVKPMAETLSNFETSKNSSVKLDASFSRDANGDELTYAWRVKTSPAGSAPTLSGATDEKPTLDVDIAGDYEIELIVNDGENNSTPKILIVTVTEGNARPIAVAGYDIYTKTSEPVTLDGSLSRDAENDTLSYSWFFASKPAGSSVSLTNSTSIKPSFAPDLEGAYVVSLRVNDGTNRDDNNNKRTSDIDNVLIVVAKADVNIPPVAHVDTEVSVYLGEVVKLTGSGHDEDGDNALLTYSWELLESPAGSSAELSGIDKKLTSFSADALGDFLVQLKVNDGTDDSEPVTATITVTLPPNNIPVANPGEDQTTYVNSTVELDGSASSDDDGDSLTYTWSLTSPEGSSAELNFTNGAKPSFTVDIAGIYTVTLIVNDNKDDSDPVSVTITGLVNNLPIANAGPDQPDTGQADIYVEDTVTLNGSESSDVDGDELSYQWSLVSGPSDVVLSDSTSVAPTFSAPATGDYEFSLVVNDGKQNSEPNSVVITVITTNQNPVASITTPVDNTEFITTDTIALTGSATDPEDGALTGTALAWTLHAQVTCAALECETPIAECTGESCSFGSVEVGEYVVKLTATDSGGLVDLKSVNIIVTEAENSGVPTITFVDSLEKGLVAYYPFNGNANDESGNENHGTVNGATLVEDRDGNVDSAYSFDGVDDFINLGNNESLDIPGSMTVTVSVRFSDLVKLQYILSDFDVAGWASQGGLRIEQNKLGWYQGSDNTINQKIESSVDQLSEVWYEVAIIRNEATKMAKLYVNANEVGSVSYDGYSNVALQQFKLLGKSNDASGDYFNGLIDDVRIYNRTLSWFDLQTLYKNDANLVPSPDDQISLCINAHDEEDGFLTDDSISWSSDLDGELGAGECVVTTFSAGEHEITVTATDLDGNATSETNIIIVNVLPEVTITSPENSTSYSTGATIDFQGMATDAEDGNISGENLIWTSSIDGELGNGESLSAVLSDGVHDITLTAKDSANADSSNSIKVCVENLECNSAIFVDNIDSYTADDWGSWYSENGIWELGTPTYGSDHCYSADNCFATILDGKYSYGPDSRLVSPYINIPSIVEGTEQLVLRFRQRFSYSGSDSGQVQIKVFEDGVENPWVPLKTNTSYNQIWQHVYIDVSAYAGKLIRFGFMHTDGVEKNYLGNNVHAESWGWIIDNVELKIQEIPQMAMVTDFEEFSQEDWHGWYSTNGIWELGEPDYGPTECYNTSNQCMATMLSSKYPYGPDSSLISPVVDLPDLVESEELLFRLRQRFSYSGSDYGEIKLQVFEDGVWGNWIVIRKNTSYNQIWHRPRLDISDYAGQRVRFAFSHIDNTEKNYLGNNVHAETWGWIVDEVEIVVEQVPQLSMLTDFESFIVENWFGWFSSNGIWELGTPSVGSSECYSGTQCIVTMLDGNYPYGPDSRLITPSVNLPEAVLGEELLLRFRQKFSFSGSDYGKVQIQINEAGVWGAWTDVLTKTSFSSVWHYERVDLMDFGGKEVRFGFLHADGTEKNYLGNNVHAESWGWIIDDITLITP